MTAILDMHACVGLHWSSANYTCNSSLDNYNDNDCDNDNNFLFLILFFMLDFNFFLRMKILRVTHFYIQNFC